MSKLVTVAIFFMLACRSTSHTNSSDLLITNGSAVDGPDHPAVVMLLMDNETLCSGTFINDFQVLTAAHCLMQKTEARVVTPRWLSPLFGFTTLAKSQNLQLHPVYPKTRQAKDDLGMINFPRGSSEAQLALARSRPKIGDRITIVGFGFDRIQRQMIFGEIQASGANIKRQGTNQIQRLENDTLIFQGFLSVEEARTQQKSEGEQAGFASGDSGGPLFNEKGELLGVTSSGSPNLGDVDSIKSLDSIAVDLTGESARMFLAKYQNRKGP